MLLGADYQTLRIKEQKNNRGVVLLTQEVFRVQAIGLLHSGNLSKQNGFVRVIKAEGRSFPAIAQSQHFRRRDGDLRCYDTDCVFFVGGGGGGGSSLTKKDPRLAQTSANKTWELNLLRPCLDPMKKFLSVNLCTGEIQEVETVENVHLTFEIDGYWLNLA